MMAGVVLMTRVVQASTRVGFEEKACICFSEAFWRMHQGSKAQDWAKLQNRGFEFG
jgi:hypothetical protein